MDIWSKEKRSIVMSKIGSKNTKPELLLRSLLFRKGFRYRIHPKNLAGKPDIVLKKYNTIIFVHGCFWLNHKDCQATKIPPTQYCNVGGIRKKAIFHCRDSRDLSLSNYLDKLIHHSL